VDVQAHVDVEFTDDLRTGDGPTNTSAGIEPRHLEILRKAKVPDKDIARLSPEQAKQLSKQIVVRWKTGMCSYGQGKILRRAGYSKQEIAGMKREQATAAIDAAKANNWQRAEVTA